jgi:phage internal scaffolding protein
MKHKITKLSEVGSKGPGMYILENKTNGKLRRRCITYNGTDSKVDQAQEHLTNVAELLEPAVRKGLLRHSIKFEGEYDDIPVKDYQEALFITAQAKSMFEQLPSKVRNRFDNDPAKFLEFTHNPENAQEMREMGILKGNDGLTGAGTPSGAPTKTDMNADGIPDSQQPQTEPTPAS